jgi:Ligand-gated ion channel.
MDGIGVRLLQAIASHMNFTIKHSYSPDLHNKKEHVTYALYTGYMIDPYSYIEPYFVQRYTWFVPRPKPHPRSSSITRVFRTEIWLCLLILLTGVSLVLRTLASQEYCDAVECILELWAVLLSVSAARLPLGHRPRLLFLAWVIFSIALTTVFQAFMTSFFIDPGKQRQIDTLEELENSRLNFSTAIIDGRI